MTSITYISVDFAPAPALRWSRPYRKSHVPQNDARQLEVLLSELETDISRNTRRLERRLLWDAARRYRRSRVLLEDLLPPRLLAIALQDASSAAVTWHVLRALCRHIRFNSRSQLGSAIRVKRCRSLAAGEVYLLVQQRTAQRDREFVGELLTSVRRAS